MRAARGLCSGIRSGVVGLAGILRWRRYSHAGNASRGVGLESWALPCQRCGVVRDVALHGRHVAVFWAMVGFDATAVLDGKSMDGDFAFAVDAHRAANQCFRRSVAIFRGLNLRLLKVHDW